MEFYPREPQAAEGRTGLLSSSFTEISDLSRSLVGVLLRSQRILLEKFRSENRALNESRNRTVSGDAEPPGRGTGYILGRQGVDQFARRYLSRRFFTDGFRRLSASLLLGQYG